MKIRDIVLAIIIIALLCFTFIPAEVAEEKGNPAFGIKKKTEQSMLDQPMAEMPAPATAE